MRLGGSNLRHKHSPIEGFERLGPDVMGKRRNPLNQKLSAGSKTSAAVEFGALAPRRQRQTLPERIKKKKKLDGGRNNGP